MVESVVTKVAAKSLLGRCVDLTLGHRLQNLGSATRPIFARVSGRASGTKALSAKSIAMNTRRNMISLSACLRFNGTKATSEVLQVATWVS